MTTESGQFRKQCQHPVICLCFLCREVRDSFGQTLVQSSASPFTVMLSKLLKFSKPLFSCL